jgi:hypothetical protein
MSRHATLKHIRGALTLTLLTFALGAILATGVGAQDFPLFVTDYYDGVGVYSLDASGALTVRGFVPGLLSSVRNDAAGNLYTCSQDSHDVSKIDAAGTVSVYATGFTSCFGLLFAPDGTLYVSDVNAGRIETVPAGGGSFTTLASGLKFPMHMTFDTDRSILVTEFYDGKLSRVDGSGNVSPVATGLDHPVGVAVGPDNNIYISEMFTGRLMRIDRAGQASLLAATGYAAPAGLDFHRDGRLFVAELSAGAIVTVDIGTGAVSLFRGGLASPAGLSFRRQFVVTVSVDLKPGSDTNPLNPSSNGVVPVAVLSSADFDATRIDPATVRFGLTGTEATPVHGGHAEDVNGDGTLDMVFDFRIGTLGIPLASPGDSLVPLKLTGNTLDGQAFEGEDVARITPNNI